MINLIKEKILQRFFGSDIMRMKEKGRIPDQEISMRKLKKLGFEPSLIFDVGAYHGDFSKLCFNIWQSTEIVAFEALENKIENLRSLFKNREFRVQEGIIGDRNADDVLFYADETASSVLKSLEVFNKKDLVKQRMISLDSFINVSGGSVPDFLKVDTQGFEFQVLKGMEQHLSKVKILLLELNFIEVYDNVKLAHEVIAYLSGFGFVPYDICEIHRRPLDNALFQIDFIFTQKDFFLRKDKRWDVKQQFT